MSTRREEISAGLAHVEQQIAEACAASGRARDDVTLIVVTKTHPAEDVDTLAALGITDVGENRHPEAQRKREDTAAPLRWHFVGSVQTNKAGAIARYADVVHSVDRAKLARSLDRGAAAAGRVLDCLVQVDFDQQNPGRAGIAPEGVDELAALIDSCEHLRLSGVMTVAPLGVEPGGVFAELAEISQRLRHTYPEAVMISAGMTEDFSAALKHGATHLRIGRAILGNREALK